MPLEVDVFFSFRSPYSYLATPRLQRLAQEYHLDIHLRPVLPLAIRKPEFFTQVNPLWPPYVLRDTIRIAENLGMPFGWPRPDPVVQEFPSRKVAEDQPYIHPLTRLGVAAALRGKGLPFACEASRVIWSGEVDGWNQGDHLARAAKRAGLDFAELERAILEEPARLDARIEENQKAHEAAGHWGVPTMVFRGEPFFGQDRIDLLVWRLGQHGLEPRR